MVRVAALTCVLGLTLGLLGCGGDGVKGVPKAFVPLTGVVTFNDQPLAGATLQFNPESKDAGALGVGVTDATGKYVAKYRGERDGIPPGNYKVTVMHYSMPNGAPLPTDMSPTDAGATPTLPEVYSEISETPLTIVVSATGGTQDFKLQGPKKK